MIRRGRSSEISRKGADRGRAGGEGATQAAADPDSKVLKFRSMPIGAGDEPTRSAATHGNGKSAVRDRTAHSHAAVPNSNSGHSDSEIPLILNTLKQLYASNGILYTDIAEQLNVSESTIKRYLGGRGLSAKILEQLCRVLGLELSEVADIMLERENRKCSKLSNEQEEGLTRDCFTSFVFYLLRCGWTPHEIQEEFHLEEAELVLHLVRLDRLRLISLLPYNRIRLLTVRDLEWQQGGPMQRLFDAFLRREFTSLNYLDPKVLRGLQTLKFSDASLVHLKDMIAEFSERVQRLAESDQKLRHKLTNWYSILLAARPIDLVALRSSHKAGGLLP